jgi:hypothetical protein
MALILGGMVFGLAVTLYYFSEGILFIRSGNLREGLILLLLWSEVLGIAATLSLVVPGVLMLRNLGSVHYTSAPPAETPTLAQR